MGIFGKNKQTNVFGSDGSIHPISTNGNISVDLSTGETYFHAGNMITGTDGSFSTLLGDRDNPNGIIDGQGGFHPIIGNGDNKFLF